MQLRYENCRVAVTGATGFIGSHLTEELVAHGAQVLAISRTRTRIHHLDGVRNSIQFAALDLTDEAATSRLLERFQAQKIFHLASHTDGAESIEQMRQSLRQNTDVMINILEAAKNAGSDTIVFGDSSKDYGNGDSMYSLGSPDQPICSYAISKSAAWRFCKLYSMLNENLHVTGLRPTMVYGPRQSGNLISYLQKCVENGRQVVIQGGWQTRDPLFVKDAVRAFILSGISPGAHGKAIPIGGGREFAVSEICEAVLGHIGAPKKILSDAAAVRHTEIFRSACDNTEAKRLLGWTPTYTLEAGLRETFRQSHTTGTLAFKTGTA